MNFLLTQRFWRTLAWAADFLRPNPSPELLRDFFAEVVGAIGLLVLVLVLDGAPDCVGGD